MGMMEVSMETNLTRAAEKGCPNLLTSSPPSKNPHRVAPQRAAVVRVREQQDVDGGRRRQRGAQVLRRVGGHWCVVFGGRGMLVRTVAKQFAVARALQTSQQHSTKTQPRPLLTWQQAPARSGQPRNRPIPSSGPTLDGVSVTRRSVFDTRVYHIQTGLWGVSFGVILVAV